MGSEFLTSATLMMIVMAFILWPEERRSRSPLRRPRNEGPPHPYRRRGIPDP